MTRSIWGVLASTVVIAVAATGALIIALNSSSTPVPDLELGDCFDFAAPDSSDGSVQLLEHVDVVGCVEPHEAQVVLVGELNPGGDREYPSDAELFELVDRRCEGVPAQLQDEFGLLPVAPTELSWSRSNGRFHCFAVPYGGGRTTGTLVATEPSG